MLMINVDKVQDSKTVCYRADGSVDPIAGKLNPTTYILGATLAQNLGVTEITEDNVDEVWTRLYAWQRLNGTGRLDAKGNPNPLTHADVVAHVGLRVNGAELTRTKFRGRLMETLEAEAAASVSS